MKFYCWTGRISRSGLTQDIKMGSCVFQCEIPHQWQAKPQVGPVSVYCEGVGCHDLCLYTVMGWDVMTCVCILWWDGMPWPVSVYCDGVGLGVMSCVCILWWGGVSFPVSILWRGGMSCSVSAAWHSCVAAHWSKYHCYKQVGTVWYDLKCLKGMSNPKQAKLTRD